MLLIATTNGTVKRNYLISIHMKAYIYTHKCHIPSSVLVSDCGKSTTTKASIALRSGGRVEFGVLISCK